MNEKKQIKLPLIHKKYLKDCDSCIKLYRDEIDADAWADYCDNVNAPHTAKKIAIYFNHIDADYEMED